MITITPEADAHLCSILEREKAEGVLLSVKGGGCAGFSYDWQVVHEPSGDPIPLSKGTLYIDPLAVMYVIGTVLDYKQDLFGTILSLDNPNVASACGCGESFSLRGKPADLGISEDDVADAVAWARNEGKQA